MPFTSSDNIKKTCRLPASFAREMDRFWGQMWVDKSVHRLHAFVAYSLLSLYRSREDRESVPMGLLCLVLIPSLFTLTSQNRARCAL